jgi:hypothetical protein
MNDLREDRELSERFMDLRREEAAQTTGLNLRVAPHEGL